MDGEFLKTPCQTFEFLPQNVPATKPTPIVPKVTRIPWTMASLKEARVVVGEGGCTVWGQLHDVPYEYDKFGVSFNS